MFTKKHYEEVALILSRTKLEDNEKLMEKDNYMPFTPRDQWLAIRDAFNRTFKNENERFDEEKFLSACGGGD